MVGSEDRIINPDETVFLYHLFCELLRRRFPLGIEDYEALRYALRAGFGLTSWRHLRALCCMLWAKSADEKSTLEALFNGFVPKNTVFEEENANVSSTSLFLSSIASLPQKMASVTLPWQQHLSKIINDEQFPSTSFIMEPQFPTTSRQIAQIWRRLRRPIRSGPSTELDVEATIDYWSRTGLKMAPISAPRRRNAARLLLLIDRQGSMTPFHWYVEHVCNTIRLAANLEEIKIYYFHDVPVRRGNRTILDLPNNYLFPKLDEVFSQIEPIEQGFLFTDRELISPKQLSDVLVGIVPQTSVVIISDAGSARGGHDVIRLLDTIAFLKALRQHAYSIVWLNPLIKFYWPRGNAEKLSSYVPMFPLDADGMYDAVNILRGQPYTLAKPI